MKVSNSINAFHFSLVFLIFLLLVRSDSVSQPYPAYTITVLDSSSTGFYFLCPFKFGPNPSGINTYQMILDENGVVVYFKEFFVGLGTTDFKLQPNGMMSYYSAGKFILLDSLFQVKDTISIKNGLSPDAHDLQILSNGHYLLLGNETATMDLSGYFMFNQNGTPGSPNASVKCAVIQEQDTAKNVVFEWHSRNYFAFDEVDEYFLSGPQNVDWTHCNAIEQDTDGNLLLSSRHFNEITKINRNDSSIMWRLGGKANQFLFSNDTPQFKGQHDIRRISNGNITLFDNGNGNASNPFHFASAKEYTLDENQLTATLTWSYTDQPGAWSTAMGNAQRLANGNTVVNYGFRNNMPVVFNCVSPVGQKIFEVVFNDSLRSYRSFNYPVMPWKFTRPEITCSQTGTQFFLDAGSGYSSYYWSNGATTQTIALNATGSFQVFVPVANGGFISSEPYEVVSLVSPCITQGVVEAKGFLFELTPNPVTEELYIKPVSIKSGHKVLIEILDNKGRIFISSDFLSGTEIAIPVKALPAGIYHIRINGIVKKFAKI